MSKTRALRCSAETYAMIAIFAGRNGLSLCEALDKVVQASGLASVPMTHGGLITANQEPIAAQTEAPMSDAEFWKALGESVYDAEARKLRTNTPAQE